MPARGRSVSSRELQLAQFTPPRTSPALTPIRLSGCPTSGRPSTNGSTPDWWVLILTASPTRRLASQLASLPPRAVR
jgi:hypothetical protein